MNLYQCLVGSIFLGSGLLVSIMYIDGAEIPPIMWIITIIGSIWLGMELVIKGSSN